MIPRNEAASRMPSPSVAKVESLLPYLIAAVLVFPSVIWIAFDTSAWGGDQSQYGFATLELFHTLTHAPLEWPASNAQRLSLQAERLDLARPGVSASRISDSFGQYSPAVHDCRRAGGHDCSRLPLASNPLFGHRGTAGDRLSCRRVGAAVHPVRALVHGREPSDDGGGLVCPDHEPRANMEPLAPAGPTHRRHSCCARVESDSTAVLRVARAGCLHLLAPISSAARGQPCPETPDNRELGAGDPDGRPHRGLVISQSRGCVSAPSGGAPTGRP